MKLTIIKAVFITSLIVANVVTGKILNLFGLILPGAALCYAVTFLCTDIIGEIEGKKAAQDLVNIGFFSTILAMILIYFTQLLPAAEFATEKKQAYDILLGTNWRYVIASMIAYYISQTWDVYVFHYLKKKTNNSKKWLRNNMSTITSQLIDTCIFITIAFAGQVPDLLWMVFSQYIFKVGIALIDTPFFYLLTKKHK